MYVTPELHPPAAASTPRARVALAGTVSAPPGEPKSDAEEQNDGKRVTRSQAKASLRY